MSNFRLAPSFLEACAAVVTTVFGSNLRFAQFVAWNGTDNAAAAPSSLPIVPVIAIGAQLVGLNMKCSRLIVTFTALIWTGTPSMMWGIAYGPDGFVVTVSSAVTGLISILALTTTQSHGGSWAGLAVSCSRSNGPAFTGSTIERPNGAPSYGPVM